MKRNVFLCFAIFATSVIFTSCGNASKKSNVEKADTVSLLGRWTTIVPTDSTAEVGIELKENGVAVSINMPTLPYNRWQKVNDSTIAIHGTSVFDGEKMELTDTFELNKEKQTLNQCGTDIVYKRVN